MDSIIRLKNVLFLLIAGIVLSFMSRAIGFFYIFSVAAFCGAGIIFLVWLYRKFYGKKN